jgi:hypothetical protein
VPDPGRKPGSLTQPDRHEVTQRVRTANDPRLIPGRQDGIGVIRCTAESQGGGGCQVHGLGQQRRRHERGIGLGRDVVVLVHQGDVQRAAAQRVRYLRRIQLSHMQLQTRVRGAELDKRGRQQGADSCGKGAYFQFAGQLRARRRKRRRSLLQQGENAFGSLGEVGADGGQRDAAAAAPQQRHAGFSLQGTQLLGHSRRGAELSVRHRDDRAVPRELAQENHLANI